MDRRIKNSLDLLLMLSNATFSLSHVSFISEVSNENALDIMEKLVEVLKAFLDALHKGAVLDEAMEKSISSLYFLNLEALDSFSNDETLQVDIRERLKKIKDDLDKVSSSGESQCINKPFC